MSVLINSYRFGTGLLLDTYPAAAAYSLRRLRTAYTGSAIRVRRASDNTEQDIGFSDNDLDMSAISTFCSGTTGHIRTWYDQSGNGNNLTQTTAGNQPIIYDGGIVTINGKPAIDFDKFFSQFLNISSSISTANNWSMFNVTKRRAPNIEGIMGLSGGSGGDSVYGAWIFSDNDVYAKGRDGFEATTLDVTYQQLLTTIATSNNVDVYDNGSILTTTFTSVSTTTNFTLYGRRDSNYSDGYGQELIFYASDQGGNRSAIETNISTFYGIF